MRSGSWWNALDGRGARGYSLPSQVFLFRHSYGARNDRGDADSILRTLDAPESRYEDKWTQIAQKRLDEIRSCSMSPIPGEKVFERIQKRFDA